MSYYYEAPYLEHYGITGQKWGVRRFQNEDGTLTAAGKDRYQVGKEYHEKHEKYAKEAADELEKKNPFVNRANQEMKRLKEDFDLDDDGNTTRATSMHSPYDVSRASHRYKALKDLTKDDREQISKKADARARERLIKEHGKKSVDDLDYYLEETKKRESRTNKIIAGGFIAAALSIPIALFIGNRISSNNASKRAHDYAKDGWKKEMRDLPLKFDKNGRPYR